MSGLILNADEIAAEIAAAIQSGISTAPAPVLYDSVTYNESTTVAGTGVNQTLFAANTNRRGLILQNTHGLNKIRFKFGADAHATQSLVLEPGETFEMPPHMRDLRSFNVLCPSGTTYVAVEIVAV